MAVFKGKAEFLTGAADIKGCPPPDLPEVCFAGRSNVGKSSLINALVNRRNLARTSNVPGKTQQMNYYNIADAFYLVDLPGYGYAKVSKKERERWGRAIKEYLLKRENLRLVALIVDARHEPAESDMDFMYWMAVNQLPFCVFLSKSDKLSNNKLAASLNKVKKRLEEMNIEVPVTAHSAETGRGTEEIRSIITEFALDNQE